MQARQRGARAVPQAPAGEHAKRRYLGPKPSDDRAGSRPDGNGGGVYQAPATMSTRFMSRAGTAQRNGSGRRAERREPEGEGWPRGHVRGWHGLRQEIEQLTGRLQGLLEEADRLGREHGGARSNRGRGRRGHPHPGASARAAKGREHPLGSTNQAAQKTEQRRERERPRERTKEKETKP